MDKKIPYFTNFWIENGSFLLIKILVKYGLFWSIRGRIFNGSVEIQKLISPRTTDFKYYVWAVENMCTEI